MYTYMLGISYLWSTLVIYGASYRRGYIEVIQESQLLTRIEVRFRVQVIPIITVR